MLEFLLNVAGFIAGLFVFIYIFWAINIAPLKELPGSYREEILRKYQLHKQLNKLFEKENK